MSWGARFQMISTNVNTFDNVQHVQDLTVMLSPGVSRVHRSGHVVLFVAARRTTPRQRTRSRPRTDLVVSRPGPVQSSLSSSDPFLKNRCSKQSPKCPKQSPNLSHPFTTFHNFHIIFIIPILVKGFCRKDQKQHRPGTDGTDGTDGTELTSPSTVPWPKQP